MNSMDICQVIGCEKQKRRNGPKTLYCHMHYRRFLLNGDVGSPEEKRIGAYKGTECKILDCRKTAMKKELCVKHYDDSKGSTLDAQKIADMKSNGCQVCGSFERLTLDHDHSCCPTGKSCNNCVRGILCHKCNTAAGLLDDDINRMISLASYIIGTKDVLQNV